MIDTLQKPLTRHQIEIIKAVLYFDVFKYPLKEEELYENSAIDLSREEFKKELAVILKQGLLAQHNAFIFCTERSTKDIEARLHGNSGAERILPLAAEYSKKIASFPFVEGVCLSGGLSKNYYDEKGDFDFFIITTPGRLWLCRTLLILRYKLLPKSKKKYWCTNYFISSADLQLPDVNAFTATELAYLIPTVNYGLYASLLDQNKWYRTRFPNKAALPATRCIEKPAGPVKRFVEFLLKGSFGNRIDGWLLNATLSHWQKKYPELSKEDFELQFRSQKNVCKRHTKGFQNKVLGIWLEKQQQFENTFKVSLQH